VRGAEGVGDDAGDFFGVGDPVGEFGDGFGEDDLVVETLEGIGFGVAEGRGCLDPFCQGSLFFRMSGK
jgi:hypothetical protein